MTALVWGVAAAVPYEWWQGVWGWGITSFLALVASAGVVMQEWRYWRDRPTGVLRTARLGEASDDDRRWEVFTVTNTGRAPLRLIHLTLVGARPEFPDGDTFRLRKQIDPGQEFKVAVVPGETATAWLRIAAHSARRPGAVTFVWHPLDEAGPLGEQCLAEIDEWTSLRARVRRFFSRRIEPVRPGGAPHATLRMRTKGNGSRVTAVTGGIETEYSLLV